MDIRIPEPLKVEHEELHAELVALTKAPGKVGEAARNVAVLLHPHFVKEEEYALPPLGLLAPTAERGVRPEMRAVLPMTEQWKKDRRQMLAEHQQAVGPLRTLGGVGRVGGRPEAGPLAG